MKVSAKQAKEQRLCQRCHKKPDWRGLQNHHLEWGSGKRKYSKTEQWCAPCHFGENGHRTEGMPHSTWLDRPCRLSGTFGPTGIPYSKETQAGIKKPKNLNK